MKSRRCSSQTGNAWTVSHVRSVEKLLMKISSTFADAAIGLIIRSACNLRSLTFRSNGSASIASNVNLAVQTNIIIQLMWRMESIWLTTTTLYLRISLFATNVDRMSTKSSLATSAMRKLALTCIANKRPWSAKVADSTHTSNAHVLTNQSWKPFWMK